MKRMADIADQAEWLTEHERTESVRRIQVAMLPTPVFDCAGCGEPIEPARKAAMPAARRCTACEERCERRDRHRAGRPGAVA